MFQGVAKHEGGALPLLEVEGYGLLTTHLEEGLVLDGGQSWVVDIFAVGEASRLPPNSMIPTQLQLVPVLDRV